MTNIGLAKEIDNQEWYSYPVVGKVQDGSVMGRGDGAVQEILFQDTTIRAEM